jgi:hypothetical protein
MAYLVHSRVKRRIFKGGEMNQVRIARRIGALFLGLTLGACATTSQHAAPPALPGQASASESPDQRPNPAGEVAKQCFGGSLAMLKAGLVGVPLSIIGVGACVPITAGVGILHAVLPRGPREGAVSYSSTPRFVHSRLDDADRSVFPQSATSGCGTAYCLAHASTGDR